MPEPRELGHLDRHPEVPLSVLGIAVAVALVHTVVGLVMVGGWLGWLVQMYGLVLMGYLPRVYRLGRSSRA